MRFRIRHVSSYRYERPVRLGPHVLRLQPHGAGVTLDDFRLSLYPAPLSLEPGVDEAGNPTHTATFEGDAAEFRIGIQAEGETSEAPELPPAPGTLPPFYGDEIQDLWRYRVVSAAEAEASVNLELRADDPSERTDDEKDFEMDVAAFARDVAVDAAGDAGVFLRALSMALYLRVRNVSRLTGAPLPPEVTLSEGQGSCRDFAVLFVACCRLQGLAARFVSGYIPAPAGEPQHMHAWAEAHVPGIGWTAWDATQGGPAGASHIPVAAAAEPSDAAPVTGSYNGAWASEMSVELKVETGEGELLVISR